MDIANPAFDPTKLSQEEKIRLVQKHPELIDILMGEEIEHQLYLHESSITHIPEGLKVGGDFYLRDCFYLTHIPKGLEVGGSLNMASCSALTHLPKMKVRFSLDVSYCTSLTSIARGVKIGDSFYLYGCTALTSLPEDLEIGNNLVFEGSSLPYKKRRDLPKSIKIGGIVCWK